LKKKRKKIILCYFIMETRRYGIKAGGTSTSPLSSWYVSSMAIISLGIAAAVPFTVCANSVLLDIEVFSEFPPKYRIFNLLDW
jgi:hypothetical protein